MTVEEYKGTIDKASETFKALCHPTRFCIVCKLLLGALNVSEMQACLNVTQSNVSQHLSILKSKRIIEGNRNGNEVYYSLVDDNVKKIVEVYFDKSEIPKE